MSKKLFITTPAALAVAAGLIVSPSVALAAPDTGMGIEPPAAPEEVVEPVPDPDPVVPDPVVPDPEPDPSPSSEPQPVPATSNTGNASNVGSADNRGASVNTSSWLPTESYQATPATYSGAQLANTGASPATVGFALSGAVLAGIGGMVMRQRKAMFHGAHAAQIFS